MLMPFAWNIMDLNFKRSDVCLNLKCHAILANVEEKADDTIVIEIEGGDEGDL